MVMGMLADRRVLIIALGELGRLVATRRGLLTLSGFGLIWAFILFYAVVPVTRWLARSVDSGLADLVLEPLGLRGIGGWSSPQLAVYWLVGLYLLPGFALMISADQTASDRARGTLRFQVLRVGRGTLYLGRFLGQCVIMVGLILATLASVMIIIAIQSPEDVVATLADAGLIVLNLLVTVLPWLALMALCSALASSARRATLYAMVLWIVGAIVLGQLRDRLSPLPLFDHLLPGSEVAALRGLSDTALLALAGPPLAQCAVLLLLGWLVFRHRDL